MVISDWTGSEWVEGDYRCDSDFLILIDLFLCEFFRL